jgi:general secretion pathway protein C
MSEAEAAEALAGIEDGAPDTRLPLRLRGVVAATEAGLGQAIIEHRSARTCTRSVTSCP